ncbi:MAG: serine/threonine-protein kinase [Planctomycetota bacterium]|nr:serine/threonine-protein kinase [Planctomycetota bacterium]
MKQREIFKPGTKAAGFNVLAELGQGAASVIYLVQDPKTKQIWALKHVVKETQKDQRFLDQAEAEYEVAAKLDHPVVRKIPRLVKNRKLLQVKDLFLVMEYVDGVSIEKHPPSRLTDAVLIFQRVAEGLAHMHDRGFVHADMKPNNVVVCDDSAVKIIDLGQSCPVGAVKERIQGTPDYIAPEQVHRRQITPRTDVYNLGATMYWVLTQKHIPTALPKGDSLVTSLEDDFIEKPKPVSELNPRVPQRLNDLIMQCVEVNPDNRPESMKVVADRLGLIYAQLKADDKAKTGQKVAADDD